MLFIICPRYFAQSAQNWMVYFSKAKFGLMYVYLLFVNWMPKWMCMIASQQIKCTYKRDSYSSLVVGWWTELLVYFVQFDCTTAWLLKRLMMISLLYLIIMHIRFIYTQTRYPFEMHTDHKMKISKLIWFVTNHFQDIFFSGSFRFCIHLNCMIKKNVCNWKIEPKRKQDELFSG